MDMDGINFACDEDGEDGQVHRRCYLVSYTAQNGLDGDLRDKTSQKFPRRCTKVAFVDATDIPNGTELYFIDNAPVDWNLRHPVGANCTNSTNGRHCANGANGVNGTNGG